MTFPVSNNSTSRYIQIQKEMGVGEEQLNPSKLNSLGSHSQMFLEDAQAVLNLSSISTSVPSNTSISTPQSIFLTGTTGFLGAFLLNELLIQTSAVIYCLIRADSYEIARKRLIENLCSLKISYEQYQHRIHPICGDISQPDLGLSETDFISLSQQIDVIYHLGSHVNHLYPYKVLRAVNVLGMHEIFKLATTEKLKPLHFMSSLVVLSSANSEMNETLDEFTSLDRIDCEKYNGYLQTKWVAEKLLQRLGEQGVPVVCYRTGYILGHSQTGVINPKDQVSLMLESILQHGSAPDIFPYIEVLSPPVDYVCRAIVYLSMQEKSFGKTYHIGYSLDNLSLQWESFLESIKAYGYEIKRQNYLVWAKQIEAWSKAEKKCNVIRSLLPYFLKVVEMKLAGRLPKLSADITVQELTKAGFNGSDITSKLVHRYLSYMVETGISPPPSR